MHMEITPAMRAHMAEKYREDAVNAIRERAVVKSGLEGAAANLYEDIRHPMTFSIEIESGKITDQKRSGRCWLFAGLNTMRLAVMKKLNLDTFELSQNHLMFWDKLEKANYFLESILATRGEPLDGRLVQHLLDAPVGDGGQWDMFCALVDKYGCVPKAAMPETFHSGDTGIMNARITEKLREYAWVLRAAHADGEDIGALRSRKPAMLQEIYGILCICLGQPPETFRFACRDKDKEFHDEGVLTPHEFYLKYVGQALSNYVAVINAPTADKPYGRTYTVEYLGNVVGGRRIKYLNLPSADLKALAIAQLKDGQPVWFGCDVGKMLMRDRGIMGMRTFDYEATLGVKFGLDKARRLDLRESVLTHAMVFLGVNLVDGVPDRWKVENSWSDKRGQDGYYIMTDEWFDQFNYEVVVERKYLSDAQRAAYDQDPIALKPWDPMGSLA
ncbi:MAG: C1 family peptidase [Clostridiales bacterium]|nr:C1 family peptidase [Clostridiales bacterium]